ncbi:hypothetical protein A3C98_00420 [Candidatus Roizmanbacteria bacterium RIFCSPHIGHO2_02_FULL_37_15]|uniref:Glycosyltransferase 2-like domain-containing protein n=1 Tax=Candidatus Roizmanbacteria bacterium RIFCSPLOWO2_01_FULL_37_16 TaxID=1802058 RepID=A0A1F7IQS3_9BACT|nr:MAG: hypothetical protein A2859_02595 [Candidatus Roizmanbacteria bacterium RIFCSPHIGHO2_01_FULL_37_16b]OGK22198.1 MAG: hypothetical protein A3C98_00420 [Candidatus Roizmanbacteria bacterium RIFCSPHIGHO2_02_FULL_37_15]OGK33284.1 MAG: hypothetical protein A3F57_04705 [Candidatus Roizmanbacteria bacterium RIFCSPHIGHO2_12_FULL_36_11]OGK45715.1 MAG: hypothetical protein A3B40_05555 [Candidatus Roizmanbacteria bacterium RIFCSPLOWO2_01_FULL_37_16]OGK57809.1 MAG: hypothetical protein A3I50_04150 [C
MKKRLSIIIIHWKTSNSLKNLLILLKSSKDYQIIVIDNASGNNLNWLNRDFSQVELIENKINRGFAFACNQGVIKAEGERLLFLNPDCEITPIQIQAMVNYSESNAFDACSVKSTDSYQKPLPSPLSLLIEFSPINRFLGLNVFSKRTLFGGCLLIKSAVLKSLGGFDERFFLWFEDSDLTLRLIKNNYKIGWTNIPIKHIGGESFKKLDDQFKKDIFFNSMEIYAKKHFNLFGQLIVTLIKKRYSSRKLLPEIFPGTSITVPNLKKQLLETFLENNDLSTSGVEWIVVTSSIEAKDIWEWRKRYQEIRFIPIEQNKGFASTVNIGFRVSTGRWTGTANDDILFTKDWLETILPNTKVRKIGSLNPVIKKESGEIESVGIKILTKGKAEAITSNQYDNGRGVLVTENCIEVDATNAACVIYNKKALNRIGLFDEKFSSYLEDIDLSLRLKRVGYKNFVSLKSKVIHIGQSSSKDLGVKKQFYDFRNWIYVILKNWTLKDLFLNLPWIVSERLKNISGILKAALKF